MIALIIVLLITACSDQSSGGSLNLFGEQPTELNSENASEVVNGFLSAWRSGDYPAMYNLITPRARDVYTPNQFVDLYEFVKNTLVLEDMSWRVNSITMQGTTAIVDHVVTFDTRQLGSFSEPAPGSGEQRLMRLVSTPEGWRVAWSRMDIFIDWTEGSELRFERTMPRRGHIYDRNGNFLVEQNGTSAIVSVIEQQARNLVDCITGLADLFGVSRTELQLLFDRYNADSQFYPGEISQETAQRETQILQGQCNADTPTRTTRVYYDGVAPHVVGYVGQIPLDRQAEYQADGYPSNALVGLQGVEQAFENQLVGTIGVKLTIRASNGTIVRTIAERLPEPGYDVHLSIDRDLQLIVQRQLASAYEYSRPTWGPGSPGAAVVVIDVNTGDVLALASYPDFEPGTFNPETPLLDPGREIERYNQRQALFNRATQGTYPLGSVFKVFSMVAGLDSGVWSPDRLNTCTGEWDGTPYGDDLRTDWLPPPGHGVLDMHGGLINSCNPYFWAMSVALNNADANLISSYAERFGFEQAPPLQGLPAAAGNIPDPAWVRETEGREWSQIDAGNLIIGQGRQQVTPLQVANAIAAVANGGMLYDPLIVRRVQRGDEAPIERYEPTGVDLGLDPDVMRRVQEAMCDVTITGTAQFVFEDWYDWFNREVIVCGKTGTAESGAVDPHAWFASFAPADNPEIAIAVIVENSCEGSEVSAPITRRIIQNYYGLEARYGFFNWPPLWQDECAEIGPD